MVKNYIRAKKSFFEIHASRHQLRTESSVVFYVYFGHRAKVPATGSTWREHLLTVGLSFCAYALRCRACAPDTTSFARRLQLVCSRSLSAFNTESANDNSLPCSQLKK